MVLLASVLEAVMVVVRASLVLAHVYASPYHDNAETELAGLTHVSLSWHPEVQEVQEY